MTPEFDVARKLKETLFAIVNHSSNHRTDAYYGGVLVDTPDGPRLAYLRLTFESTEPKPKRGMPPYTESERSMQSTTTEPTMTPEQAAFYNAGIAATEPRG